MPTKTLALIIGLTVLTIVLLIVALLPFFPRPQETGTDTPQEQEISTAPAHTTISMSPNPVEMVQGSGGSVDVLIDTGENEATAVQLEISYDPQSLGNFQITPGDFFENPITLLNQIDPQTGRITYALGITPSQTPVQGNGIVARIIFTALPQTLGQSQLEVLPKTIVTQEGSSTSVLQSAQGATVVINPAQNTTQPIPQITEPGVPELISP